MTDRSAEQQLLLLWQSGALGVGLGVLFDFFNAAAKWRRRRRRFVFLCDVSFFALAGLITFYFSLVWTDGQLHPLLFFGIAVGFVVQYRLFGRYFSAWIYRLGCKMRQLVLRLFAALFYLVKGAARQIHGLLTVFRAKMPKKPLEMRKKSTFFRKKS